LGDTFGVRAQTAAGHDGGHVHDVDVSAGTRRLLAVASVLLAIAVGVGMLVIGFGTDVKPSVSGILAGTVYEAKVERVGTAPCQGTTGAEGIDCRVAEARLTQGPDRGKVQRLSFPTHSLTTPKLRPGDRVVLTYQPDAEPGFRYIYADRQRRRPLIALTLVFAIAVVLLGRWRGLAALGGIVVSLIVILQFILPAILEGHSPVVVAVLGSAAIAYIALYLAHGFNALTTVALLGTLAALALTIVFSAVFTALCHFSGFSSDEALVLGQLAQGVDINGLFLAGVVIGALGALDDVTVTQAAAIAELHGADPTMGTAKLYKAGIRIGRDHIASTTNTLALAYAGAALPLLLLLLLSSQSLGAVANSEVVATEIVRTLVGSIGLVSAVPITTWLAARVVGGPGHRQRSLEPARRSAPATDGEPTPHEPEPEPTWNTFTDRSSPERRRGRRQSSSADDDSDFWR
jgi:uncharacterized membrane protein